MAFEFDRYINGELMAEGVTIERQDNLPDAMRAAARIASRGPNGEAPVLVLRAEALSRTGAVKVNLSDLIQPLEGYDPKQPGYSHRKGWNDAIMRVMDLVRALDPAASEGQQPVTEAVELSGNTGELIDKMAEAIRGDTTSDDTPWATLSEERKEGWRGDAERALAVVKEYLTTRRLTERAVTEAMVEAAVQAVRQYTRDTLFIDEHRELVRAALKAAMEAGR